jgi:uncharacterized repeat protein (TIGR03809 family)
MTHRADVARGRDIFVRWQTLAERRLDYLTELFETGRWRRYHGELAFLENIKEAKTAVETWRDLVTREALRDNSAVDISWLGRGGATLHRVSVAAQTEQVGSDEAPSAPVIDNAPVLTLDGIEQRYPLLRNAL